MAKKKAKAAEGEEKKPTKKAKGEAKPPKEKKTAKKAPAKKSRSKKKEPAEARKRLFWGVFNHALKRVALFDFNQKKAALKRAEELSEGGKPPHFVQKVKEEVTANVSVSE